MSVRQLRLTCPAFAVDVRLLRLDGKWLASADTVDGPSLGTGRMPLEALMTALEPFGGFADDLLETVPDELDWASR